MINWLPPVALSIALTVNLTAPALGASQFEMWWQRYEATNDVVARSEDVKQAVSYSYRMLKLSGYCDAGNHLDFDRIVEDPMKSSCCGDFADYTVGAAVVEAGTSVRWYPKIDLKSKERIWQELADKAMTLHEDEVKDIVRQGTRADAGHKIDACFGMLTRKYPD
jgi:hypothetical protein